MEQLFIQILNMSLTASYVIAAILLVRLLLKKAPKKYAYALWAVAAFRLVCPVSFSSVFSLLTALKVPVQESAMAYIPRDIVYYARPVVSTGIPVINSAVAEALPPATEMASVNPIQVELFVGTMVWLLGIAVLLLYGVVTFWKLKRQLRTATMLEETVYQSEAVSSPFILGFVRPKIYIPYGLDDRSLQYVLTHERYHLKQKDHWVKPLAWLILCVHWFNPLVWLAFHLMGKDMEMRCDEKVLETSNGADYSDTLLSMAVPGRFPSPSPLAFGESGVKTRIKNALSWKKPRTWVTILALVLCVVCIAACAANPVEEVPEEPTPMPEVQEPEAAPPVEEEPIEPEPWELTMEAAVTAADTLTVTAVHTGGEPNGELGVYDWPQSLERLENNKWVMVPPSPVSGGIVNVDSVPLNLNGETILEYPWQTIYGALPAGQYRITLTAAVTRHAANRDVDLTAHVLLFELPEAYGTEPALRGDLDTVVSQVILQEHEPYAENSYVFESHVTLSHMVADMAMAEGTDDPKAVIGENILYMVVLTEELTVQDGELHVEGGGVSPRVLHLRTHLDGTWSVVEFWMPGDGAYYWPDIQEKFPSDIVDQTNTQLWIEQLIQNIRVQAVEAGLVDPNQVVAKLYDRWTAEDVIVQRELRYYKDYTLAYVFEQYLQDGAVKETAMLHTLNELLPDAPIASFETWFEQAKALLEHQDAAFIKENHPTQYLALEIAGLVG